MNAGNQLPPAKSRYDGSGEVRTAGGKGGGSNPSGSLFDNWVSPLTAKVLHSYLRVYRKIRTLHDERNVDDEIRSWQARKQELLRVGRQGYRARLEDLGLAPENLECVKRLQKESKEVTLADIDQDGFLLSHFGPISNGPTVSRERFQARWRFDLKVVAVDGYVAVRKNYRGNKSCFINEVHVLHKLGLAGCNVPSILNVDFERHDLTCSYILGDVLREELAKKGALVRDRDVARNPSFKGLTPNERYFKRIEEGKRVLYDVIDAQFAEDLLCELNIIHETGLILNEIKYGNIIIEKDSGKPYLIDFEKAEDCSQLGDRCFQIMRKRDLKSFDLHFDTERAMPGGYGEDTQKHA